MSDKNAVSFNLVNVSTEQFAIVGELLPNNEPVNVTTNFRFGIDPSHRKIAVFSGFTFLNALKFPFLMVEGACHFQIAEKDWLDLYDNIKNVLTLPKGFAAHLLMLSVGTTRGILHAKTENTPFNKFFIPLINVSNLIVSDVVLNLENSATEAILQ
jgi:hypothetical protein